MAMQFPLSYRMQATLDGWFIRSSWTEYRRAKAICLGPYYLPDGEAVVPSGGGDVVVAA